MSVSCRTTGSSRAPPVTVATASTAYAGVRRSVQPSRSALGRAFRGLLGCLLRCLLRRALGRPLARRRGALRPTLREQLGGAVDRHVGDRVALAQARVRLAVGDVRTEPSLLHYHRLARGRVGAKLAQW